MKTKIKIHREYDEERTDSIICDICKEVHPYDHWKKQNSYQVLDTEVSLEEGVSYPEGGSREITSFDICPKCFKEKLIPWMKSFDARPNVKEWDNW